MARPGIWAEATDQQTGYLYETQPNPIHALLLHSVPIYACVRCYVHADGMQHVSAVDAKQGMTCMRDTPEGTSLPNSRKKGPGVLQRDDGAFPFSGRMPDAFQKKPWSQTHQRGREAFQVYIYGSSPCHTHTNQQRPEEMHVSQPSTPSLALLNLR